MKTADPVIQLVNIITGKLKDNPEISELNLLEYLEEIISEDSHLKASLNKKITQTNRDSSTGYQTFIEGGRVSIGGINIILPESGKIDTVLEAILQQVQSSLSLEENLKQYNKSGTSDEAFPKKILFLSANPKDEVNPYKAKELSVIEDALYRAGRARFKKSKIEPVFEDLIDEPNVGAVDLSQKLSAIEPHIIHISGLKGGIENLVIGQASVNDEIKNLDKLIEELFEIYARNTQCIILNRCYLEEQGRAIAYHVEFLVGIRQQLEESLAIIFLNEFYFQLGLGMPVKIAYNLGRSNLLRNHDIEESQLPIILEKGKEKERRHLENELALCEAEINRNFENPILWRKKGSLLRRLGRTKEADEALETAYNFDQGNYKIRAEQGDSLEQSGSHEKAVIAYNKALDLEEKDYRVWWKKGIALAKSKKYSDALESYKNALSLEPSSPDQYIINREIGLILGLLNQSRESIAYYKAALKIEPRYRAGSYEKKEIYRKLYSNKEQSK